MSALRAIVVVGVGLLGVAVLVSCSATVPPAVARADDSRRTSARSARAARGSC